jgi:uncharacterized protein
MQNPYYDMTVPVFKKMLQNLDHLLTVGSEYAVEKGINEETMLGNRLAPDMFPLSRQIQIATDNAKGCVARLCGIEAPVMEDTETTVAELHTRIANTIAFIESVTPSQFEGAHDRKVFIKYFPETHFIGYEYLTQYALPNFFFHTTTAYALLRAMGAPIGKKDYVGPLSLQPNQ